MSHLKATPTTALAQGYVQGSVRVYEAGTPKGTMGKGSKGLRLTAYQSLDGQGEEPELNISASVST